MATYGYPYVMGAAKLDVQAVSRLCKALGDETRLRIIALLAHGELCVCHIQDALELSQPNVSRQLGILRAARLVADRREGSWVYYHLLPQESTECERLFQSLVQGFAKQGVLRRDVEHLVKVRGPRACR